jgi:predicted unusual protein kinase regulating ubiquinone biosynthesis (AarF/ABC1/UbiB family)
MVMQNEPTKSRPVAVPAKRLTRLGQLGSITAGVAGSMALNGLAQWGKGQRPVMKDLLLTPKNFSRVADQLAKMRGAAMKVGQLVSMDTGDMLPPELAQIMARLRDDAHFMPPAQLKQVLNAQWPANWINQFKTFDVRPIAAASIGQVHRVTHKDGRDLAIKVQYPGVAQSIDSDVANVGALIRMSGLLPKGLDLAPYLAEARAQLHEETDYIREAGQMMRFTGLLADQPQFVVPDLQKDWSTSQILTMSFVPGISVEETVKEPQELRDRIATQLITLTLRELFEFGFMQTDPNFANYRYQSDTGKIVLLDFGAARDLSPRIVRLYRRLLQTGLHDDAVGLGQIADEIGFIDHATAQHHRTQVITMIRLVMTALQDAPLVDFGKSELSQRLQAEGIALAEDGFVPPPLPIDVLLLQRKFGGVFLLASRLGARVDVLGLLRSYLNEK